MKTRKIEWKMWYSFINNELERAVREGNFENFKVRLSKGADIDHIDENRNSLLHLSNNVEISWEILFCGVCIHSWNRSRETPLIFAVKRGYFPDVIRELLNKNGANVRNTDIARNSARHIEVKKNLIDLEVVGELLKYGSNINRRSRF